MAGPPTPSPGVTAPTSATAAAAAAAAAAARPPPSSAPAPPSAANPNLAYLNPIDRTAYTKNVVQSHSAAPSSSSASASASASPAAASAAARNAAAASAALPASAAAPLAFDAALLAAPSFDAHSFIAATLSRPPPASAAAPSPSPSLQSLHGSLTAYSGSLHASLVALLNSRYESFITLSSSLLPLPPLLAAVSEYAEQVREKGRAMLLLLRDKRAEEEGARREWAVAEERERWLAELSDCVERVRLAQAVMAEADEAADAERMAAGGAEEGEEEWAAQLGVEERAVVRRALKASREGAGGEEKRRREERRQQRRVDRGSRAVAAPSTLTGDDVDDWNDDDADGQEEEEYETDDAIKRQHNAAYDLFLALLSTPPPATTTTAASTATATWSQLYRLTHLTVLFISLRASMALMSQFQLISSLQSTVSALYTAFLSHLQRAFLTAISTATASSPAASSSHFTLTSLLRLYVLLDERSACESLVRDQLLVPALQSIFSAASLRTNPSASSGGSAVSNLGVLYGRVLDLVERVVCVLNEATCAFSPRSFDWFGDVFFVTLAAQLAPLATALFSPGTPTVFHCHYTLSCSLLSSLSALAAASSAGVRPFPLLSHQAVDGFMKRFNLSIYFRLRFQQIATTVEAACSSSVEQQQPSNGDASGWRVPAVSGAVSSAALQCWADGVWLAELSGSFLKLSAQCFERYSAMLEAGCKLTAGSGGNASAAATNAAISAASGAAVDGGSAAAAGVGGEVVCALPVELLYAYHNDVARMAAFIDERLSPAILDRLPVDSSSSLSSCLDPAVARLRSLGPLLLSSLTALLASAAAVPLSAVPRLTQIYRMSKKGPTAPSPYVAQVVAALVKQQQQQSDQQRDLARLVVGRVCSQWMERVAAVLDVASKMEASLRLLKKKGADGTSEVEKIRGQLEIDVRQFERAVRDEVGVAVEDVQPFQQLQRLIHTSGSSSNNGSG